MELNFEGLQMQKWNILTDRAQRLDEKNGVISTKPFVEMLNVQPKYWKSWTEVAEQLEMLSMFP